MRVANSLLLVICFLALTLNAHAASVGWLSELPEGVTVHRTKAGIIDESGWCDAVSSKGSFQVRLPVTFEDWSAAIEHTDELTHSIGGTSVEGIVMLATEFPTLSDTGDTDIKQITQRLLEDVPKRRIRYSKVQGMDASQVRLKKDGRQVVLRHILAGDKLYRLSIDSPLTHKRKARKLETKFFSSFRLKVEKTLAEF